MNRLWLTEFIKDLGINLWFFIQYCFVMLLWSDRNGATDTIF